MSYTEPLTLPSRGIIYQLFIDDCLVDCPIKAKNMNQNDLLAVLFKARVMTLGSKLKQKIVCPECNHSEDVEWDLNNIPVNYLYVENYPISIKLPNSDQEIKVRFPTGNDISRAKQEAERRASNFKKQVSDFLQVYTTVSLIDLGGKDIVEKAEWYEHLSPHDAIYIDEVFAEMGDSFGVKMTREEHCSACDKVFTTYIDIGSDFFRPYANVKLGITSKAGNLAGAIEKSDIS